MKKILILANNDLGLYKFRKELLEELVKENEVYVSLPNGEFVSAIEDIGCNFIETPVDRRGTNPLKDLKLLFNYISIIRKLKPDIVLTYTIKPNVYGGLAARINKTPYIANITGLGSASEGNNLIRNLTIYLHKIGLKKAKCLFFQNEENMRYFEQNNIKAMKHELIPGSGVNLEHFSLLKYPSREDSIEFIFISRIMKEKGIDHYLEAAEIIKKKYPDTKFHVLGFCEEEYENVLDDYVSRGIIEYHGLAKDIRPFLAKTHCTIHPTYYPEGISNVLLESAASGRPIITTNRSGCREIVEENHNGYLIEPRNTKQLIEKIETFLNLDIDEKKRMGRLGRKKVEKEFDRRYVVMKYLSEIKLL